MSSDRQRSDDESPSTSSGSSDADQRDPAAPEPEEQEERKPSAAQQKKNTKLSSKTTAKLSTSAKRIQKELAEITLDPPPNCSAGPKGDNIYEWRSTILGPPGSVYEGGVFFWISHFHQIIHLSHQRLLSAPEFITATSTVRESSVWTSLKTTGVPL